MLCPNCKKELDEDVVFCPYCGTKLSEASNPAEKKPKKASGHRSRKTILVIVIVVIAVIVVAGVAVSLGRNSTGTSPRREEAATLSAENIAAAKEAVTIVDNYLDTSSVDAIMYGSESAATDLREVKDSLAEERNTASDALRQQLEDDIDQIILELDLNEKSISNGLRIIEGGEVADRELIQSYRDDIESLVNTYS